MNFSFCQSDGSMHIYLEEHETMPAFYNRLGVVVLKKSGHRWRVIKQECDLFHWYCAQCGQIDTWCEVYTGCPSNKGHAHKITLDKDPFS